jgi:TldD protein
MKKVCPGCGPHHRILALWTLIFASQLLNVSPFRFCRAQPPGGSDVVLRAMNDELARAVHDLRLEDLPRPYYVDYLVFDSDTFRAAAVFGGLARSHRVLARSHTVNVRVGDYRFDNTNFAAGPFRRGFPYDVDTLPIEDDYYVLRRHFWLSTDEAYKAAVEALARKQASMRNVRLPVPLNDFARQEPVEALGERGHLAVDENEWDQRLRELSAVFRRYPKIKTSRVEFEASAGTRYFINSEGTRVREPEKIYLLQAFASTQAADGMRLYDAVSIAVRSADLLGTTAQMRAQIEAMAERLSALVNAGTLDSYSGPVLFERMAAAQVFAETLGRNLAVTRMPLSDGGRGAMFGAPAGGIGGALNGRRKSRVLPDWIDVVDDPTQTEWRGRPLLGHYDVDLEGVKAQRVELIRRGVLENYLLSRLPVKGFEGSNGHARLPGPSGTALAGPGNLFIIARQTVPEAQLKQQLIEMCRAQDREFGLIVRRLDFPSSASRDELQSMFSGQSQDDRPTSSPIAIYKVFVSDGHEEPVRGLRFRGFSIRNLKDIIAAGDQPFAFDFIDSGAPFALMEGAYGAETSVVAPSILMEDVELKGSEEQLPRLPVVPHPYFAASGTAVR